MAPDRSQALQERLLALAGSAAGKVPEPEPDTGERNTGDGSHEQATHLVASILGGTVLRSLTHRDVEAKDKTVTRRWVDDRTGELVP